MSYGFNNHPATEYHGCHRDTMTFAEAEAKLTGRCKEQRKLENNTYLVRMDEDRIAVQLHATYILTLHRDGGFDVNTGGWNTVTTKDRISRYIPKGWSVGSVSGQWFLYGYSTLIGPVEKPSWYEVDEFRDDYDSHRPNHWRRLAVMDDCIHVSAEGQVFGGGSVEEWDEAQREQRRERARVAKWLRLAHGIQRDRSNCRRSWCRCHPRRGFGATDRPQEGTCAECGCVGRPMKMPTLTTEQIMAEENITVRMAMAKCYGLDRFLLDIGAKAIDAYRDYELLQFNLGSWDAEIVALKMRCPSTTAVYISPVDPGCRTVSQALDWYFNTNDYLGQLTQES